MRSGRVPEPRNRKNKHSWQWGPVHSIARATLITCSAISKDLTSAACLHTFSPELQGVQSTLTSVGRMTAVFRDVDKLDPMPDSLFLGQDQQYLVS
jgi:hypothetical protein